MLDLVLLLAMTCVAEIDLQDSPAECVAMWSVNERTARRRDISLAVQTRAYNAYWRNPRARAGRPWIAELDTSGNAPEHWPSKRSWKRSQPLWDAYVDAAEQFVAGAFAGSSGLVCPAADHYGGIPGDGLHADDAAPCAGARRVHCLPGERQAYWAVRGCRVARRARSTSAAVAAARPR